MVRKEVIIAELLDDDKFVSEMVSKFLTKNDTVNSDSTNSTWVVLSFSWFSMIVVMLKF